MKIILLHGEDNQKSYAQLQKYIEVAKKRGWEVDKITDKSRDIAEAVSSAGLFIENKLVVVENLKFITKKVSDYLLKKEKELETTLLLYHPTLAGKLMIKILPKSVKIEEFKLPKVLWIFLESISPGNIKNSYELYKKVIATEHVELVFALIVKQIKDMYWLLAEPESVDIPSWRMYKLKKQASKFSKEKLEEILEALGEADIKSKSSKADLSDSLDFIFATMLK